MKGVKKCKKANTEAIAAHRGQPADASNTKMRTLVALTREHSVTDAAVNSAKCVTYVAQTIE